MSKAWVSRYVGLPWVAYATGPHAYDCWGLVVKVSFEHFGRHCHRHIDTLTNNSRAIHNTIRQEIASGHWQQIDKPVDGSVVLLSLSRKFHHIGIWLDVNGGMLLHSFEGSGVCLSSYSQLQEMGFRRIEFWEQTNTSE
jgi:hypothetical protein